MKKNLLLFFAVLITNLVIGQSGIYHTPSTTLLIPYRDGKLWGYCDTMGKVMIKPAYDSVTFIRGDGNIFKNGKQGVINSSGKMLIPPMYDAIESSNSGYGQGYSVQRNNRKGYFNAAGKPITPVRFDDVYMITDNLIQVTSDKKYGLYNMKGEIVLPAAYDYITDEYYEEKVDTEIWLLAGKAGKQYLVNKKTGKVIVYKGRRIDEEAYGSVMEGPPSREEIDNVNDKEKVQQIFSADEVTLFKFKSSYEWDNDRYDNKNYYLIKKTGKQGLVKRSNLKLIVPAEYDSISCIIEMSNSNYLRKPSECLVAVKKDGKCGIINESGDIILNFEYDGIGMLKDYANGFELQQNNKKGALLLYTFYPAIQTKYDSIKYQDALRIRDNWSFSIYKITLDGKAGYVGENGVEYFK
jgi:WG containing repeat